MSCECARVGHAGRSARPPTANTVGGKTETGQALTPCPPQTVRSGGGCLVGGAEGDALSIAQGTGHSQAAAADASLGRVGGRSARSKLRI